MKRFNIRFVLAGALAALFFAFAPAPARAQSIGIAQPIIVKQSPPKGVWLKAEVIHADSTSIMVRDQESERKIYTFSYSEKIQGHMDKIMAKGGYQSGDKVKIRYVPGYALALDIKGKPSKPI
ncbi:MAG TPA: hypothetical protein VEU52_00580 [Candidatus Limnocylindrales bacterium]|jgi:hypothetical protein|nr:hypothetical protein [Candidatus Limnocylindrales bacterium]